MALYVLLRCAASYNPISIFKLLLFQRRIVRTKLDIYPFYHYDCVDTSTGGLLVSECIIPPVFIVWTMTWLIASIYY
jgi:hypothetical protein